MIIPETKLSWWSSTPLQSISHLHLKKQACLCLSLHRGRWPLMIEAVSRHQVSSFHWFSWSYAALRWLKTSIYISGVSKGRGKVCETPVWIPQDAHLFWPIGSAMFDAPQDVDCPLGSRGTLLAHTELLLTCTPRLLLTELLSRHTSPSLYLYPAIHACIALFLPTVSILLFFSPVSGGRGITGLVLYRCLIQHYFTKAQLQWVPPPVLGLPESTETTVMSDFTTCKTGIVLPATFVLHSGASIGKMLHKCSTFTISNSKSRAGQVQQAGAGLKSAAISRVVCAKCFKNNLKMWE